MGELWTEPDSLSGRRAILSVKRHTDAGVHSIAGAHSCHAECNACNPVLQNADSLELLQLGQDFIGCRAIVERFGAVRITQSAVAINDECGRAIAQLGVDSHLEGNAIRRACDVGRIKNERIPNFAGFQPHFLEKVLGRPGFMRINDQ